MASKEKAKCYKYIKYLEVWNIKVILQMGWGIEVWKGKLHIQMML